MPALSEEQIERFHEDGCLLVEDVLPAEDLTPLIREFEQVVDAAARRLHAEGALDKLFPEAPFERRLAQLYAAADAERRDELWRAVQGKHHKTPGLFAVFTHPALLDIAEALLGPEILAHPQFNSRAKLPHQQATVVPWHQDLGYLDPEATETFMVNCWIPLVDATMEMGAMQVIPGSHRWGLLPHEQVDGYLGFREESLPPHESRDCPMRLGGVVLLQHQVVHRSVPNTSPKVRWSLDLRYCRPDAPTGRAEVPGFLCRSRRHPERVAQSVEDWLRLMNGRPLE